MSEPLISVVMPVWNGESHLRDALDSILGQTFRDFEFIILDDGSTDNSPNTLAEYAVRDSRIRVIHLEHEGIVAALNRGVAEARAGWIARMDCDDISHPKRLETQLAALTTHHGTVLCHTAVERFGDATRIGPARHFAHTTAMLKARLCFSCPIIHPSVVFSTEAFHAVGGYREEERHAEDFALWGRMIAKGDFLGIATPLVRLRVHGNSISKHKAETQQKLTREIAGRHSKILLGTTPEETERLWNVLTEEPCDTALREWIWASGLLLRRIKPSSPELWAWILSQALRRLSR